MAKVRKSVRKQVEGRNGRNLRTATARRSTARKATPNGKHATARANGQVKSNHQQKSALTQREKLEQERAQVMGELERLRAELQEAPEPTGDEVDLNVYEREKTLGLLANYERRLDKIEYARRAAQKGAYGICERCGRPIDPARLKIFPETTHCVQCKNELEQQARRRML